jgi:hypothetical protein
MAGTPLEMTLALCAPPTSSIQWTKVASQSVAALAMSTLKTWINRPLEDVFWDTEAAALALVAQRAIEAHCEITMMPSAWVGTCPWFPWGDTLVRRPFGAVTRIDYTTPDGAQQILDGGLYFSELTSQFCGTIRPADNREWPALARRSDAVRLTVGTWFAGNLPEDIMHALMMTVAHLDSNRGDMGGGSGGGGLSNTVYGATHANAPSIIPMAAQALLRPYRYMGWYTT